MGVGHCRILAIAWLLAACEPSGATHRGALEIAVAPLALDHETLGVACYSIRVEHQATLVFEDLWVCSGPSKDHEGRAVPGYGSGPLGDIIYVGACVADDADGATINRLTVALHVVYGADGEPRRDLVLPPPLVFDVPCKENDDTRVTASFVVMLAAHRGFVDLVVRFDEIMCAAKVDCAEALVPIAEPALDAVVVALTCSARDQAFTRLYADTFTLACTPRDGGAEVRVQVDPTRSPGLFAAEPATSFVVGAVGSEGVIDDGNASYWTLVVALDDLSAFASCALTDVRLSAGTSATLPSLGAYPIIGLVEPTGIRFWDGSKVACKSPLDGPGSGLSTTYSDATGLAFDACLTPVGDPAAPVGVTTEECNP